MMTIITKEFLDNLKSAQFMLLFVVSLVLFFSGTLLSVATYGDQLRAYSENRVELDQHPSTVSTTLYPIPEILSFMSSGNANNLPSEYSLKPGGFMQAGGTGRANYRLPDMPTLDWAFVIKLMFSLLVILLGYDTIAGERQQGTLRLMLSTSTGRVQLLAAKYVAIMATVALALAAGILLGLIAAGLSLPDVLTLHTLAACVMMFVLAMLYVSVFVFLCLLVSSAMRQSSLALLVLLSVWVVFTIIIPDTAGVLAEKFTRVPTEFQLAREVKPTIQKEIWKRIGSIGERIERGELRTDEEVKRAADQAFSEGELELRKHFELYANAIRARAAAAQTYARFSPTALFQFASEGLSGTGAGKEEKFLRDAADYSATYDQYVLRTVGKVVGGTSWSFAASFPVNGKQYFLTSPRAEEYQGDKSDFPEFSETSWRLTDRVSNALLDASGLLLWNLVLAVLSFVAILRSDVR